jgi:hypothetical protein
MLTAGDTHPRTDRPTDTDMSVETRCRADGVSRVCHGHTRRLRAIVASAHAPKTKKRTDQVCRETSINSLTHCRVPKDFNILREVVCVDDTRYKCANRASKREFG